MARLISYHTNRTQTIRAIIVGVLISFLNFIPNFYKGTAAFEGDQFVGPIALTTMFAMLAAWIFLVVFSVGSMGQYGQRDYHWKHVTPISGIVCVLSGLIINLFIHVL